MAAKKKIRKVPMIFLCSNFIRLQLLAYGNTLRDYFGCFDACRMVACCGGGLEGFSDVGSFDADEGAVVAVERRERLVPWSVVASVV